MRGLMMDGPLTLSRDPAAGGDRLRGARGRDARARRPAAPDRLRDVAARARRLAAGLERLGIRPGDRVATLCMNHDRHLEAYFGVPAMGAILHTLNPRLHADDLALIVRDAGDRAIVVDEGLLPVLEALRERADPGTVIVAGDGLAARRARWPSRTSLDDDPGEAPLPEPDERDAAFLCYTSGTTGAPKGVLYSHRALVRPLAGERPRRRARRARGGHRDAGRADVPRQRLGAPVHLRDGGRPPWCCPGRGSTRPACWRPSPRRASPSRPASRRSGSRCSPRSTPSPARTTSPPCARVIVGGSAAPRAMMEGFERRHGIPVLHAWGMTETTPVGTVSRVPPELAGAAEEERFAVREAQGRPVPFVEVRARGDEGLVAHDGAGDGRARGARPVRRRGLLRPGGASDRFTDDGWFRTGDIVTIDERQVVRITDREKDLVKSGGEWISSVALENALMGHPDVAEAAVIAVPDPKWQERPLAVVVLRDGASADPGRPDRAPAPVVRHMVAPGRG